ncbi:hypothetical protein HanIR_Chr03g0111491 [Helianthus annuus]|nr:hypothetical protein HanIR_Chr03g0111491 [Helianthus annuus]
MEMTNTHGRKVTTQHEILERDYEFSGAGAGAGAGGRGTTTGSINFGLLAKLK